MSIGDVIMVFEGAYAQYLGLQCQAGQTLPGVEVRPHDLRHTGFRPVPGTRTGRQPPGGHVYVTNGTGSNPYDALPSYCHGRGSPSPRRCAELMKSRPLRVATVITRLEGGAGVLALRGATALDPAGSR